MHYWRLEGNCEPGSTIRQGLERDSTRSQKRETSYVARFQHGRGPVKSYSDWSQRRRSLHKSKLPLELTTIRRLRRRLTGAPAPDNNCLRYSTDRLRRETRSIAGCSEPSGSHPLNRTHFSLVNFLLLPRSAARCYGRTVILRQPDTLPEGTDDGSVDTRNRFRIRVVFNPSEGGGHPKEAKKSLTLHSPREGIRRALATDDDPCPPVRAHTRSHAHARTHGGSSRG